ncbi:MAG: COQ9 family protein [Pseudomonadota bacterium]
MAEHQDPTLAAIVEAALPHVAFDGWSPATFRAAVRDSGTDPAMARALAPRGSVDLALAFHRQGDARMRTRLAEADLSNMRYRDKVAHAVRQRIEAAEDREAVRRGMTLFALPPYAALGAQALWGTADAIWDALGDTSDDVNWYTKRATLSGVYGSTVLYWLGDDSPDVRDTWAFLERRIEDVMRIEKLKAQVRKTPVFGQVMEGPNWVMSRFRRPPQRSDVPGI